MLLELVNRNMVGWDTMGLVAQIAAPDLIKILQLREHSTRDIDLKHRRIFAGLRRAGPKAKSAVPGLILIMLDPDREKHYPTWNERVQAAEILGVIGPDAKEGIPAFLELLKGKKLGDFYLRLAATKALGNIRPAAKVALPALTDALDDQIPQMRAAAREAIRKISEK